MFFNIYYNGQITKDSPQQFLSLAVISGETQRGLNQNTGFVEIRYSQTGRLVCEWGEKPDVQRFSRSA